MPESAALGQMKTGNLSQDVYDQGDYFFSLAAAAVNHQTTGASAKSQEPR